MNAPMGRDLNRPVDPGYRPLSWRRRVLIAVLAVATAFTIVTTLLDPPGGIKRQHLQRADAPLCSASQPDDCVGGKVDVLLAPAAPSAVPSAAPSVAPSVAPFAAPSPSAATR